MLPVITHRRAAALATIIAAVAAACATDDDCERLGACDAASRACVCARGFTGASCGELDLLPNPPLGAALSPRLWPTAAASAAGAASAWGFTAAFDPSDGQYHAVATVACNGSGVLASGGGDSWLAHLVSASPDGGWTFAGMFAPQTTFGPHVARAADGTLVVVFRVNALVNTSLCAGNGSGAPLPDGAAARAAAPVSSNDLVPGDPERGTSMYVAWARAFAGPWAVARINVTGVALHTSNPSLAELATPLGTDRWVMAYRYNPQGGGELNAIALAPDFRGPWRAVVNVTATPGGKGNYEDPFVWQPRDGDPLFAHMLLHAGAYGYHMWGPLNGSAWRASPAGAHAFNLTVPQTDGTVLRLKRRERPELRFRADGSPAALVNGVQGPDGAAFSYVQALR